MSRRFRQIAVPLLAVLGVQFWLLVLHGDWGHTIHIKLAAGAIVAAAIGPLRRLLWRFLSRLRRPGPKTAALTAVVIAATSFGLLTRYALASHRDLFPSMHDEFQFLLQARMIASGRLWMPGHPLVDFFDTFYVLIQPKYAAQSFPGAAMFFVPAIWLHIPPWVMAVAITSATIAFFYLVVLNLIDGLAGVLAAILLASLSLLHYVSTMVLAQMPVLFLGLAAIWCYLRFRRRRTPWRALVLGVLIGWMLITRPADAVILSLPIAADFVLDIFRRPKTPAIQPWLAPAACILAGIAPFVALQIIFNVNVTGDWLKSPFQLYNERDQPGLAYSFHPPAVTGSPLTHVPEKRRYFRGSVAVYFPRQTPRGMVDSFTTLRLPTTIGSDLPQPLLAALLPIGLLAWGRRRAWMLACTLPLFFLIYAPYPLFTAHYCIIVAPAAILTVLLAPAALALAYPRLRRFAWTALAIFTAGIPIVGSADAFVMNSARAFHSLDLKNANAFQATLLARNQPALILFRRSAEVSNEIEPVYNLDTPWPDDALVIRAHDRGRDNGRLYRYYAAHGPDRAVYRIDEVHPDRPPRYLGMVSGLAKSSAGQ